MKILKKSVISLFILSLLALPVAVGAQPDLGLTYGAQTGLGTQDLKDSVMQIVNIFMGFLGIIAVIIILYGGFLWMTAAGNEEKVGKAKKLIIGGIVGLAIILSALAITNFVINSLLGATGVTP